jgi:hypothetical protein
MVIGTMTTELGRLIAVESERLKGYAPDQTSVLMALALYPQVAEQSM